MHSFFFCFIFYRIYLESSGIQTLDQLPDLHALPGCPISLESNHYRDLPFLALPLQSSKFRHKLLHPPAILCLCKLLLQINLLQHILPSLCVSRYIFQNIFLYYTSFIIFYDTKNADNAQLSYISAFSWRMLPSRTHSPIYTIGLCK